jgi:sulfatase modifying factor 1
MGDRAIGRVTLVVVGSAILTRMAEPVAPGRGAEFATLVPAVARPIAEHEWQELEGKYWQIASPNAEDPYVTDAAERTRGACATGMVEIRGRMKVEESSKREPIEELQKLTCTDWIAREYPERCARYDRDQWVAVSRSLPETPLHYCIDRFEYPNRRNAYPWIVVSFNEARDLCAREEKRLCTEDEWTFACEGEQAVPFPYGYVRDPDACVVDRLWRPVDLNLFAVREGVRFVAEIDHLWQGEASGARPRCRSSLGVYDLTGNVDEWTTSVRPAERPSILKGGYWGRVRTTCRATTRAHGEGFFFYQIGFRCCAEVPAAAAPSATPSGEF